MNNYKVIFAKDEVIICLETTSEVPGSKDICFERNRNGHLIYALVKADSEEEACILATKNLPDYLSTETKNASRLTKKAPVKTQEENLP
jgi:hypothetical protein